MIKLSWNLIIKEHTAASRSKNATVDIEILQNHSEHINNGRQPMQSVLGMSSDWFKSDFMDSFKQAAQFIYNLDLGFDLRRALPYAGTC